MRIKKFQDFCESTSFATSSSVNGMGATLLPTNTEPGSGDIPHVLPLGSKLITFRDYLLYLKKKEDELQKQLEADN